MAPRNFFIFKADGRKVKFNPNKILSTCIRAGANRETAQRILKKVRSDVYHEMGTSDIYKLVLQAISEEKDSIGLHQRYQLKEAIMRLGPSGFAFENYVADLLEFYDLQVYGIRVKVKGKCALHEIDLIGVSDSKQFMIECKHDSYRGSYVGLKVALYTHARFLDTSPRFSGEMIFCNSKISESAKKYAICVDQHVFSWRYPPEKSLEKIIEKNKLYPITILNLTLKELEIFYGIDLMIAKDLLEYNTIKLSKKTGIHTKRIQNLQVMLKKILQ
ncbi:MAG: restriction endonuclease [Nitrosarchaeum sp.]|nr:restriction endonuclease [Nitrosarchaeum sp.]